MSDPQNLLIFGCGFSGKEIARQAKSMFDKISGTHRKAGGRAISDYQPLEFDGSRVSKEFVGAINGASHILMSIAPDERGDCVLKACREALLENPNLKWLGYLSTVGVYGNHDGAWVDEDTQCKPVSKRSIWRMQAETQWQSLAGEKDVPLSIFRLSGIYGRGRNAFMNIEKGTARRLIKPGQVFNRIHHEDIGRAVYAAMQRNSSGLFNITDDEPAPPQDVVVLAHQIANKEPPPEMDFDTADLSPMARSFYGENKRVSNQKSKTELGISYKYPNYREALEMMWQNDTWR